MPGWQYAAQTSLAWDRPDLAAEGPGDWEPEGAAPTSWLLEPGEHPAERWADADDLPDESAALPAESPEIAPALLQLAPMLLTALPTIVQALQAALPALGGIVGALAPRRESDSEDLDERAAVLEATLGAMETALGQSVPALAAAGSPREPGPDHREWIPAVAGIIAALAPVVSQVVQSLTSKKSPPRPAPPPPARPGPAPAPASPAQLASLNELLPLLAQLMSQLSNAPTRAPAA